MRAAALLLLLLFWGVSVTNLDRFPPLHNDSVAILASGHKLFTEGVYGLDMYAGLHGREQIYLEVMPLMSWLQGLSQSAVGLGVWQMRLVPVIAGFLTLSLTYGLARTLINQRAAVAAMLLLLFWQWAPGGDMFFGSGVALVDVSRIARYDILVAPLSTMILWCCVHARRTGLSRYYFLSGMLTGLAGLTQLYGLFWVAAIGILWALERRLFAPGSPLRFRHLFIFLLGTGAAMSVWVVLVVTHWPRFVGQMSMHASRFDLFRVSFYLNNLLQEGERYFLGVREAATFRRCGFWLVIIGLPLSLLWLARRVVRRRDRRAMWLLMPTLLFPILFALFVQKKQFAYLMLVMPLFAVTLSWPASRLLGASRRAGRVAVFALTLVLVLEGSLALRQMQVAAGRAKAPDPFFAELREALPPGRRVLGPQTYWLALPDREYRSFILPLLLVRQEETTSLGSALAIVDPDIVLVNRTVLSWLTIGNAPRSQSEQLWAFMRQHRVQLIGTLTDHEGQLVQIYGLN